MAAANGDSPPATPLWVKVFGIIALVLLLLFIILHVTGQGLGDHIHRVGAKNSAQP